MKKVYLIFLSLWMISLPVLVGCAIAFSQELYFITRWAGFATFITGVLALMFRGFTSMVESRKEN